MLLHINGLACYIKTRKYLQGTFLINRNASRVNICFLFPHAEIPGSQTLQTFITHHMEHLNILSGGEDHLGLQARLEEEAMSHHGAASTRMREG